MLGSIKHVNFEHVLFHPSSDLKPSVDDINTTKKLAKLCNLFDMNLIDSLIVGPNLDYTSIRSELTKEKTNDL